MSQQVYRINEYKFNSNDLLFFDANIWLYIYGPEDSFSLRLRDIYSLAFRQIRSLKAQIFIDVIVLSEFVNTYSRLMYNRLPPTTKPRDFKTFRNSEDFKPIAQEISKYSRRIVSKCQRVESGFKFADLSSLFAEYAAGGSDFNDQILAGLCRDRGFKFVTHDGDFKRENLTIITANLKLLN